MGELEDYIKAELSRKLEEVLAALPWWCLICGEGGNYIGERPDEYWFPPKDHECPPLDPKPVGIPVLMETFDVGPIFKPGSFLKTHPDFDNIANVFNHEIEPIEKKDKKSPGVSTMSEDQWRERGF